MHRHTYKSLWTRKIIDRRLWFSKILRIWLIVAVVVAGHVTAAAAQASYIESVDEALEAMKAGRNVDAVASLVVALETNANDPLARVALGTALLHGGQAALAEKEYHAAAQRDADCGPAYYGLGLVALLKADLSEAVRYFCRAQQACPEVNLEGSIGYVKMMAGGDFAAESFSDDESLQALKAVKLTENGQFAEAFDIWKMLQDSAVRPGFGERLGCAMTFVKAKPLVATGESVGKSYMPAAAQQSKLPVVSGNVSLKADLSKAANVHIVSFFVDGRFVGMTNTPPFNYVWDTKTASNGAHVIKIEGTDIRGDVVSAKSMDVVVENKGSDIPSGKVTGKYADAAWQNMWTVMLMKPSASAINYNMALCARQLRDAVMEKTALERVLAADPSYADAAHRLALLRPLRGTEYNFYKGSGNRKALALTFDDGPKADTGKILDILNAKGVKATFFVVGKQVDAFSDQLRRIADDGHEIGNHTYNHRNCQYLSESEIMQEIFRTSAAVRALTGREIEFFRPPGGHSSKNLSNVMRRFGLTTAYWSVNCSKYEGTTRKKLYDHVVNSAQPGGIILLHNLELVTVQALPEIIDTLRSRGYSFVTLSELKRAANEGV